MQNFKLIFAPLLYLLFSFSSPTDNRQLVVIFEPFKIVSPKNSPPYYAYLDLLSADQKNNFDSKEISVQSFTSLRAGKEFSKVLSNQMLKLAELKIEKVAPLPPEEAIETLHIPTLNTDWKNNLTPNEQERIRRAGIDLIENDWKDSSWDDHVKKVLVNNGVVQNSKELKSQSDETPLTKGKHRIQGPIEMCCGLALTNQHRFSIRRYSEGIAKESGIVDANSGEFQIDIQEPIGEIVATLSDEKGKVLGEGSYKITEKMATLSRIISTPTIHLTPKKRFYGNTRSVHNENSKTASAPTGTRVFSLTGEKRVPISNEGVFEDSRFSSFSTSSIESSAPGHWTTSSILTAANENKILLFPDKFIKSMENVLRDNPIFRFTEPIETVVWGKVQQDGKPTAGIQVVMNDDPTGRIFYLNEFYFPDSNLTSTSSSGIFVAINSREGFQSLSAYRGKDFFGYKNVLVKRDAVAMGDIDSSIKINPTSIRIFDAFDGVPLTGLLNMQSHPDSIYVEGHQVVPLSQIEREGVLILNQVGQTDENSSSMGSDYISAQYFYNESRGFIRIPGIKKSWLEMIKVNKKINMNPNAGVVVGFFDEEDFEAYVGGSEENSTVDYTVLYFDSNGNLTDDKIGHARGGFVIFNAPPDAQNIIVMGKNSETINSRLIPVKPEQISVLNF